MELNDGEQGGGDGGAGAGAGGEAGAGAGAGEQGGGSAAAALLGGAGGAAGEQQQGGAAGGEGAAGGDAGQGQQGADPDWYGKLSAEADGESASNRDWIKAKGFRDLDGVTKALRSAEKSLHDTGRVKVPGEGATPEEVADFHRAIGVPEKADGYVVEPPKGADGQPLPLDEPYMQRVKEAGLKYGIPKAAMEGVLSDLIKGDLDSAANTTRQQDEAAAKWFKDQGEHGAEKIAAIDRAADALGLSPKEVGSLRTAWGSDRALTIMSKLGEGMAEDKLLFGGDRGRFGIGGAEAQAELNKLKGDPEFSKKASIKGSPENQRWNRLNDAAAEHQRRLAENG